MRQRGVSSGGRRLLAGVLLAAFAACVLNPARGDDWPQWRGPGRDNKVTGFVPPSTWPKELKRKWQVTVGDGVSSPALAGGKLYVFGRQGGDEVLTCLDAATGTQVWADKHPGARVGGAAGRYEGPRSTPAVGGGKVCAFGVGGVLSCLDAADGKVAWRKESLGKPRFYTAASPLVADGLCILHVGSQGNGDLTAFDLATGDAKWKFPGDGPGYGSPVLATIDGVKQVLAATDASLVGVAAADGKLLWKTSFSAGRYPTATPIVDGRTVIAAGRAFTVEKQGDAFAAKEAWKGQAPHMYNTPVLRDGLLYGLAGAGGRGSTKLFCQDAKTGKTLWTDAANRGECGFVLDAGPVLVALSTDMNLVAFKPSPTKYEEVAKYRVAETPTWTCPVLDGRRVYVKDRTSVALWEFE